MVLKLRSISFDDNQPLVMAIVNRTPDSFYDQGSTYAEEAAWDRVAEVVEQGADIVDIGGVKAGYGAAVSAEEEIDRVAGFVARVRGAYPQLAISVDTWRASVARAVLAEGADLINDAWGGHDPGLVDVVAEFGAAVVCTHAGGLSPRTDPHRQEYDDVMASMLSSVLGYADRARAAGVAWESIIIDPAHDFAKNTFHSLETTRRLGEMVATGYPVLVSLSNKDFIGETLGRETGERLPGTLAATAISAWLGARIYRAHNVRETRDVIDMSWSIAGRRPPYRAIRGLS
ncbi:dihydropteroate synthase [Nocardioides baekrokdamisoli]|uniref:Dihydropteroate synthase n=1 Tax=Nocardioides baekrokdamisoli TaxID=1804624 RepID=A0A3G9J097_9ACTN|nr:dihydropteroate synthase [Nocardioides baekrokdamisoli]BBH17058.1 dihydropteroate synthase [Nocardioides baekrokdamisoli]